MAQPIQERLRGSIVPLVTPFTADNAVDEAALRQLIEWQIASGTHGISVTGTTGEPSSLTRAERRQVFEVTVKQVAGRVPVVLATGSNNLEETLELTHVAETLGADAALVIVPYYNRPSQEGLYRYFTTVARSTALPLIIYNIPGRTAVNIEPLTVKRIRQAADHVIGIKESHKDFEQVSEVLHTVGRDFLVYSGIETLCFPMLAVGGAGHISATANLLPKAVADLYNWVRDGQWEKARDLHYALFELNQALFWETNPGPLKTALSMMGRIYPAIRLPLTLLEGEQRLRLARVLTRYGLIPEGGHAHAVDSFCG